MCCQGAERKFCRPPPVIFAPGSRCGNFQAPTFLCLAKEKSPPQRWKRKRFCAKRHVVPYLLKCEGRRGRCGTDLRACTGCALALGNREVLLRIWRRGWDFRGGYRMATASLSALPALLSAAWAVSGAAAGREVSRCVDRPESKPAVSACGGRLSRFRQC